MFIISKLTLPQVMAIFEVEDTPKDQQLHILWTLPQVQPADDSHDCYLEK